MNVFEFFVLVFLIVNIFLLIDKFLLFFNYFIVGVGSLDVVYVIIILVLVNKVSLLLIFVLIMFRFFSEVILWLEYFILGGLGVMRKRKVNKCKGKYICENF